MFYATHLRNCLEEHFALMWASFPVIESSSSTLKGSLLFSKGDADQALSTNADTTQETTDNSVRNMQLFVQIWSVSWNISAFGQVTQEIFLINPLKE